MYLPRYIISLYIVLNTCGFNILNKKHTLYQTPLKHLLGYPLKKQSFLFIRKTSILFRTCNSLSFSSEWYHLNSYLYRKPLLVKGVKTKCKCRSSHKININFKTAFNLLKWQKSMWNRWLEIIYIQFWYSVSLSLY